MHALLLLGGASTLAALLLLRRRRCRADSTTVTTNPIADDGLPVRITPRTRFVLSTSGRPASARRYQILLRDLLDLDAAYVPISSNSDGGRGEGKIDPACFAMALRGLNAIGGAISRDIKGTIAAHLDEVDDLARAVGAVNTVVVRHGSRGGDAVRLVGYNTDAAGESARPTRCLAPRPVVLVRALAEQRQSSFATARSPCVVPGSLRPPPPPPNALLHALLPLAPYPPSSHPRSPPPSALSALSARPLRPPSRRR